MRYLYMYYLLYLCRFLDKYAFISIFHEIVPLYPIKTCKHRIPAYNLSLPPPITISNFPCICCSKSLTYYSKNSATYTKYLTKSISMSFAL